MLFVLAAAIVVPLYAVVLLAVLHLTVNEILGVRKWTCWRRMFDVTVVEERSEHPTRNCLVQHSLL